jgi:hypothetical protein
VRAYAVNAIGTSYGEDLTFTTLARYTLNVTKSGTGSGDIGVSSGTLNWLGMVGSAEYDAGTSLTLTATSLMGSSFTEWTGCDSAIGTSCLVLMSSAKSIGASFSLNTYQVSFSAGSGGSISGTSPQTISHGGSAAPVEAIPQSGWSFINWTGTGGFVTTTSNPLTVSNVTGAMAITANFSDTGAPQVGSVSPGSGATGVGTGSLISATFSEAMDSGTITGSSFQVKNGANEVVSGTVGYNAGTKTATFSPTTSLSYATAYTATIKATAKDVAGNALASDYSWSFTTLATVPSLR